jgi:hypothetical protein
VAREGWAAVEVVLNPGMDFDKVVVIAFDLMLQKGLKSVITVDDGETYRKRRAVFMFLLVVIEGQGGEVRKSFLRGHVQSSVQRCWIYFQSQVNVTDDLNSGRRRFLDWDCDTAQFHIGRNIVSVTECVFVFCFGGRRRPLLFGCPRKRTRGGGEKRIGTSEG